MTNRQNRGRSIGAGIGAILGAVLFDYLLAFEPWGIGVSAGAGFVAVLIGTAIGAVVGGILANRRGDAFR